MVNHHAPQHHGHHAQNTTVVTDSHPVGAFGTGAVAAGGNINGSTITSGHGNQVGNGNVHGDGNVVGTGNQAVTGDHDTTGFGTGAVSSTSVGGDLKVDHGSAFASGGSASVDNSDNSAHHSGNTTIDASTNHSFNNSSDHSVHHSGNTWIDGSSHDSGNIYTHYRTVDSFNDSSHHDLVDLSGLDLSGLLGTLV